MPFKFAAQSAAGTELLPLSKIVTASGRNSENADYVMTGTCAAVERCLGTSDTVCRAPLLISLRWNGGSVEIVNTSSGQPLSV